MNPAQEKWISKPRRSGPSSIAAAKTSWPRQGLILLLVLGFLQLPAWLWTAPVQAETLATYPAVGEMPLLNSESPRWPAQLSLNNGLGYALVQPPGIQPFIASGDFLTSPEVLSWNAANIGLALVLFQIYNQHQLSAQGAGLAAGMILLVPVVSWLLLMGAFLLAFPCGYAGGDCWIPYSLGGVLGALAFLLPVGVFLLGISWLPPEAQVPAFKAQVLSF